MGIDNANHVIEQTLNILAQTFEKAVDADVLAINTPLMFGTDDLLRRVLESKKKPKSKLAVVLETGGGYIAPVERMVRTMRMIYKRVEFYVPNHAFSAGTVLVMSGDAIHMDWYSVLGPIDPQVQRPGKKQLVPALGYLIEFERLIAKSRGRKLTTAEMAFLVEKFDAAELYLYKQERELSIELLREWLAQYKFKDWQKPIIKKVTLQPSGAAFVKNS